MAQVVGPQDDQPGLIHSWGGVYAEKKATQSSAAGILISSSELLTLLIPFIDVDNNVLM